MKRGVLIGEVWATRKAAGLAGKSLKLVLESPSLSEPGALYAPITVAIDTLDGKLGQPVLVAYGSGARNVMARGQQSSGSADAAVAVLLDGTEPSAANDDPAGAKKE